MISSRKSLGIDRFGPRFFVGPGDSSGPPPETQPEFIVDPSITGNPYLGSTLTGIRGSATGGGLTWSYQWVIDGVDIPGATSQTLLITEDIPRDAEIEFKVTVTNSVGSDTATSNPVSVLYPPELSFGGGIIGGDGLDDVLEIEPTGWIDAVTESHEWYVNLIPTGYSGDTYSEPRNDGDSVTVLFSATNPAGTTTYRSNAIVATAYTWDADALNYISRVESKDGQPLEEAVKKAMNEHIFIAAKQPGTAPIAASRWDAWLTGTALCMAGPRTLAGALEPLHPSMPTPTNVNFVSGEYNRKTGLSGPGSGGKYLNLNINNNTFAQNNQSLAAWVTNVLSASGNIVGDNATHASPSHIAIYPNASTLECRMKCGSATNKSFTPGFVGTSRHQGSDYIIRSGGSNLTANVPSVPTSATVQSMGVFARVGGSLQLRATIAFVSAGGAVGLTDMDSNLTAYMTALAAALP